MRHQYPEKIALVMGVQARNDDMATAHQTHGMLDMARGKGFLITLSTRGPAAFTSIFARLMPR